MRGTVRRTHNSLSRQISFPTLERVLHARPRFLLHGVVAAVGVAAISSIAFQPRHVDVVAEPPAVVEASAPMVALDFEPLPAQTDVVAAAEPVAATPEPEV